MERETLIMAALLALLAISVVQTFQLAGLRDSVTGGTAAEISPSKSDMTPRYADDTNSTTLSPAQTTGYPEWMGLAPAA